MKKMGWLWVLAVLLWVLPRCALGEDKQVVITFIGDCTLGSEDKTRANDTSFDSYAKQYGYDYFFENVKPILERDDLTVANLEGVLADKSSNKVKKGNSVYNFRGPAKFVEILTASSIECVNIANNHALDFSTNVLSSTKKTLTAAGVNWFGSIGNTKRTWIYERDGVKIGFVGMEIIYWGKNQKVIESQVKQLRKDGCQVIVGVFHGGTEYAAHRDYSQENIAHRLIKYGCDLVIGHHAHVLQGIEVTKGVTICYSLGNFVFGGNAGFNAKLKGGPLTALFQFTFSFDGDNQYLGHQLNIIPALYTGEKEYNNYQPVLVTGSDAKAVISQIQRDTKIKLKPYVDGVGAVQDFVPAPGKTK